MSDYKSSVKKSSSIIGALVLLPPIILTVVLMILPAGCGSSSSSATPVPTQGTIQIGFTDSPSAGFQNILLNVVSVRLNPSTDPNVLSSDPNWVTITAPAGLGAVGELQIDLNQLQGAAKLFNSAIVTSQTYNQLEVLVDSNTPGGITPTCSQPPSPVINEGCVTYGVSFSTGSTLHADLTNTTPVRVTAQGLTPVVIDFNAGVPIPPPAGGTLYSITPVISVVPANGLMAAVNGTVTGSVKSGLLINAELAGTNTIIETAAVVTTGCPSGADGCFNLSLPAAPAAAGGTAYDIFMSGGTASFNALSNVVLTANATYQPNLTIFGNSNNGTVSGLITNQQFLSPIQAATAELLFPSTNDPGTDVVVVSTATDPTGFFTFTVPTGDLYTLKVQQTGFNPVTSGPFQVKTNTATSCPGTSVTNSCNFGLVNGTLSGTVSVDVPPTNDLQVLVVAEDSGTANLENVTLATIPRGVTQGSFSMMVPTSSSVPLFDLVASAQDSFQGGAPSQNTGHSIAVLSQVPEGANVTLGPLDCLGHGSLSGLVSFPDSESTVLLLQNDTSQNPPFPVVVGQSTVGLAGSQTSGQFSFCAPPNESVTYLVQRAENGSPVGSPTGVPLMATPLPAPSATPCPICFNSQGFCPGNCVNTGLNFSLPPQ